MLVNELNNYLKPYNLSLNNLQLEQFKEYKQLIIEYNKNVNLTSITDPAEMLIKHFFDSLTPGFYLDFQNKRVIDIGAGAGFPGIPLKILFPSINLTLLDSLKKRVIFLEAACKQLGFDDAYLIHGRAEELAHDKLHREQYDIVIARAVARLNVLMELSLPFARVGGVFVAMKGSKADEELSEGTSAINILGGKVSAVYELQLPNDCGERSLIIIDKVTKTLAKYPRRPGEPTRKPLM